MSSTSWTVAVSNMNCCDYVRRRFHFQVMMCFLDGGNHHFRDDEVSNDLCVCTWGLESIQNWLVVWNMWTFFHHIWDVILPIDELHFHIFQRGWLNHQPVIQSLMVMNCYYTTYWYLLMIVNVGSTWAAILTTSRLAPGLGMGWAGLCPTNPTGPGPVDPVYHSHRTARAWTGGCCGSAGERKHPREVANQTHKERGNGYW